MAQVLLDYQTCSKFALALGVVPVSGVGQLGAGEEETFGDPGADQVAPPRRLGGDEVFQGERADPRQHGLDVPMGERARPVEGVSRGDEGLALERAADPVDDVDREIGAVSEGLMLDLAVLTEGASEVVTDRGYPLEGVRDSGDMDRLVFACHAGQYRDGIRGA